MTLKNADGQDNPTLPGSTHYVVHGEVEEKARLLQDNNQDTYRALADEIFKAAHGFEALTVIKGIGPTKIPASLDTVIKDRLVYAEMQYREGTGKGVTEQSIVNLSNMLAHEMNLPNYTRTNQAQVHFMRMALIRYNPTFMGYRAVQPAIKVGESMNEELSPLQATHLLLEVLGHKLSDPTFQVAPEDWERYRERMEAWRQEAVKRSGGAVQNMLIQFDDSKSNELRQSIGNRVSAMSPIEGLLLLEKGLDSLGIGR